jgi:anti-sigma factor RsiW
MVPAVRSQFRHSAADASIVMRSSNRVRKREGMKTANSESGECKSVRSSLDSYAANELDAETRSEVIDHLESCERRRTSLNDRARLKARLRQAILSERAPEDLRRRIGSEFRTQRASGVGPGRSLILSVGAVVLIAIALGLYYCSRL